jgi:predicted DNA-binding protein YlxM (UPF0122 family)
MEKRIQVSEKIQRFIKSLKRHPDCFEFEQVSENEYVLYYEDYPHPPIINPGPQTFKALYRKPKFEEYNKYIMPVNEEVFEKYTDEEVNTAIYRNPKLYKEINNNIINQLKEPIKSIMYDRYVLDISLTLIAKRYDLNVNTVKTRIRKGQTIFAHILHKYFPTIKDYKLAGRCNTLQEELNEIFIAEKNKSLSSES